MILGIRYSSIVRVHQSMDSDDSHLEPNGGQLEMKLVHIQSFSRRAQYGILFLFNLRSF